MPCQWRRNLNLVGYVFLSASWSPAWLRFLLFVIYLDSPKFCVPGRSSSHKQDSVVLIVLDETSRKKEQVNPPLPMDEDIQQDMGMVRQNFDRTSKSNADTATDKLAGNDPNEDPLIKVARLAGSGH